MIVPPAEPMSRIVNPFQGAIVQDAWENPRLDVPEIHAEQFELCRQAVASVFRTGRSSSLLLLGERGSGKTHLLARLRRNFLAQQESQPGGARRVVFVAFRLQTNPGMIWRHLRRRFVDDLLRATLGEDSQLDRLLTTRLASAAQAEGDPMTWWREQRDSAHSVDELESRLDDLFTRIGQSVTLDHALTKVLIHWLMGRHRPLARAWLRGEALSVADLNKLGLATSGEDEWTAEDQAQQLVLGLCHLAGDAFCLVFCFDQVEALQLHSQDPSGLAAFGKAVTCLHDETHNVAMISCIQSALHLPLLDAVHGSEMDRISSWKRGGGTLNTLPWSLAKRLIAARLDAQPALAEWRKGRNGVWPLDETVLRPMANQPDFHARKLLAACAEQFEQWRTGQAPPPRTPAEFLHEAWEQRVEQARTQSEPAATDEVLQHGLPLLADLPGDERWRLQDASHLRDVDLLLEGDDGRVAVSVCNQNTKALWRRLARLREQLQAAAGKPPFDKLVLLRDPRLPIPASAKTTRQVLEELTAERASYVTPSLEVLAALDALRRLLADAQAGDLANRGEALAAADVKQWLVRHLPEDLRGFRDDLFARPDVAPPDLSLLEDLAELVQRRFVLDVREAAELLQHDLEDVEECVRRHAARFGVLDGPALIILRPVSREA